MQQPEPPFAPSPDVRTVLNVLIDRLERRSINHFAASVTELRAPRSIKVALIDLNLPGYTSQIDPEPRQLANDQLQWLESIGVLRLFWQPGEKGHLLEAIALIPGQEHAIYKLLGRIPTISLRTRLESQLLGDRFHFNQPDWQYRALEYILQQIKEHKSPAPFLLNDPVFNEDLLLALSALNQLQEETPFRVFSVRVFNDSKRFEDIRKAVVRLTRIGRPDWRQLPEDELLRELNLVANPSYILLAGPWVLADSNGQRISLGEFSPSVGFPAVQAAHLERVTVHAERVLCVENLTTFHALASDPRLQNTALLGLAGNPSPAVRRLLKCLTDCLPEPVALYVWADLDYGGFNIMGQLRREVSTRFVPYHMDVDTLDRFAQFARPLTLTDRRNLERQEKRAELEDVRPVIAHLLKRGIKLEQEAVVIQA